LINTVGAKNVAVACRRLDRRLVHLSTEYVFSGDKDGIYSEDDPTDASDWYGHTKALGETQCQEAMENVLVLRLATPFQAHSDRKLDMARRILTRLQGGHPVSMFSDTTITPTWTDDVARALRALLAQDSRGIYQTVGASSLSPFAFALAIAHEFRLPPELVQASTLDDYLLHNRRPYARNLAISNSKLQRETGLNTTACAHALHAVHRQMEAEQ
jgi:dTDP-4-dehydrorhamnose reductase